MVIYFRASNTTSNNSNIIENLPNLANTIRNPNSSKS